MSFAWPELFPILLAAPLALMALWALDRARARRLFAVLGPRAARASVELSARVRRGKRLLFAAALLFALLAVLQPVWGEAAAAERRGVDIVVCLDVSRSMLARDLVPSRLERAREEIRALAGRAAGDRLGLVAFAGEARVVVPLTRDTVSFAELAGTADELSVACGGTDLGAALETAFDALADRTGRHATVLLLTDGDDLAGRGLAVARELAGRRIAVHAVGFGSALGAKIPVDGGAGEEFLRDPTGAEVVTAMDVESLARIARATGGEFVDAADRPRALVTLYEEKILPMAREAYLAEERKERENRFQWPLLLAILLWSFDLCLGERRS